MKVKFWTEEEDKIICEHYPKGGRAAVELILKSRTSKSIMARASKLGIIYEGPKTWSKRSFVQEDVSLDVNYEKEITEGPRRVYSMDSERNHAIQKSHPVKKYDGAGISSSFGMMVYA